MPEEIPLEPRFVVWHCDHCRNGIEFDAVQLADREECRVPCPHCGKETALREPLPPPPLIPDDGWSQPAPGETPGEIKPVESVAPSPVAESVPQPPADVSTTIFISRPKTVSLPPEPLPPMHTRPAADERWLTDLGVAYFRQHQFSEAFLCFQHAAQRGLAAAQFCLAVCYLNGQGAARDDAAALPWLRAAAEQGDANAEFALGIAYRVGRGIAADAALGEQWLQKAAAHGHAEALRQLATKNPLTPTAAKPPPPEKTGEKRRHELQRLVLGLFRKK
jgi:hypothetical protein